MICVFFLIKSLFTTLRMNLIHVTEIIIQENEAPYTIEEIIVEEPQPIEKSADIQKKFYGNTTNEEIPQARVLYNGNQLWKAYIDTAQKIAVLAKLRDENGKYISFEVMII